MRGGERGGRGIEEEGEGRGERGGMKEDRTRERRRQMKGGEKRM